jgi:hypothetical protein
MNTKSKLLAVSLLGTVATASSALAVDPDYSAILTTNVTAINTLWGTIVGIVISVALVTVGVRFFKKIK